LTVVYARGFKDVQGKTFFEALLLFWPLISTSICPQLI